MPSARPPRASFTRTSSAPLPVNYVMEPPQPQPVIPPGPSRICASPTLTSWRVLPTSFPLELSLALAPAHHHPRSSLQIPTAPSGPFSRPHKLTRASYDEVHLRTSLPTPTPLAPSATSVQRSDAYACLDTLARTSFRRRRPRSSMYPWSSVPTSGAPTSRTMSSPSHCASSDPHPPQSLACTTRLSCMWVPSSFLGPRTPHLSCACLLLAVQRSTAPSQARVSARGRGMGLPARQQRPPSQSSWAPLPHPCSQGTAVQVPQRPSIPLLCMRGRELGTARGII